MSFNIGSQSAGIINNVAGDQHVAGGQQGVLVTTQEARRAVDLLREALDIGRLDEGTATSVRTELDELTTAVGQPEPDRARAAGSLERLTRLLSSVGAISTASTALIGSLHTLAGWLGPLAAHVVPLLPAL